MVMTPGVGGTTHALLLGRRMNMTSRSKIAALVALSMTLPLLGCGDDELTPEEMRTQAASYAKADISCQADADCCTVVDDCTSVVLIVSSQDQKTVEDLVTESGPTDSCRKCGPPLVQVRCTQKRCVGYAIMAGQYQVEDSRDPLSHDHCGTYAIPANTTEGKASVSLPAATGPTNMLMCE
jgi:hypothetical protein